MAKVISVKPKRGRPFKGGREPFIGMRLPAEMIAQIDDWAEKHEMGSRSEAMRHLIELGLGALTGKARGRK